MDRSDSLPHVLSELSEVHSPGSPGSRSWLVRVDGTDQSDDSEVVLSEVQQHDLNVYRACAQEFHELGTVKSSCHGFNQSRFSVHITLILAAIVFCASVATGVTPLTILSMRLSNEIDDLAMKLAGQVTDAVKGQLQQLTQPCRELCDEVHRMFQYGLLSPHLEGGLESGEVQALYTFLYMSLGTVVGKDIPYLYVGTEYSAYFMYELQGEQFLLWNRTLPTLLAATPGSSIGNKSDVPALEIWRSSGPGKVNATPGPVGEYASFDPRKRPWYVLAKAGSSNSKGWVVPYIYVNGVLGTTAFRALRNTTGHFMGAVGSDITLQGLVDFLNSDAMRESPNMRHTVIESSGLVVGSSVPGTIVMQESASGDVVRLNVLDTQQPEELRVVVQALQGSASSVANISTGGRLITLDGKYVYAALLQDDYNMSWTYIMYVPTSDFLGHAISTTNVCIGICVGVIVGMTLVSLFAAWDLSGRLRLLAADMQRATSLALDGIHTQENVSRVHEIQAISIEFNKLVNALRSFQKYLPQAQVGFLLSSNLEANLAAIHQQVTVMFLDVENFTGMVESLNDTAVIMFYGDLMTLLTDKVLAAEGTLDKYIGDAIMAFWNMPRRVPRHEQRAVEAALACREALPLLERKGWIVEFRIGINTGKCQVGNFGSHDRLNYTAIGDNVNVASRLESLCKAYHARVLVSGSTHAGLDNDLLLTRLIDRVAVKGKDAVTVIHQVLGWKQDATNAMLQNYADYQEAFQLSSSGAYVKAREVWERAAGRGDATAQIMVERLQQGQPEPDGIWRWHTK
eukprot:GGOE01019746.1.p1 GENE.GGOE01019746.1~~GGOE01019746.1.p1  ORF type:complete len:808 (-),score=222.37 GGOE01019746.1:1404-3794(-)